MNIPVKEISMGLARGDLRRVHHIAFNVQDMDASRYFYGTILGLHELTGDEVPKTLTKLVQEGKVANFVTPDGTVIDLFWEPELSPPDTDPEKSFTRANHLAFDIEPQLFDHAVDVLRHHGVKISTEPVTRPTGRGVYFYDPDGFILEIRCSPEIS
ncbi:MAG: VOC family protein [Xenococcus sp. MO_188.B8]|nr:VOC family protein [Xenococcus sp. MO_188.B8]